MKSRQQVRGMVLRKGSATPRLQWKVAVEGGHTVIRVKDSATGRFAVERGPAIPGLAAHAEYRMDRGVKVCTSLLLTVDLPPKSKRRRGIFHEVDRILGRLAPGSLSIQHPQCPDNMGFGIFHLPCREAWQVAAFVALQDKNADCLKLREKF